MKSRKISGKTWWGALAAVCLLCIPIPVAFAQSQTAQSIMVQLDYDSNAYEIVGEITWTYQRDLCAAPLYTANAGVWNGIAPTCTGSATNCAATNQPGVPAAPAIPTTGPNSVANHAQDDRCAFFCGGNVPSWNYTQTRTVNGLNKKGNWTFTYNYTTVGAGAVAANTCWTSEVTGGTVDVGFDGFVCSESFLKQSTRRKYSFTLTGPAGSRANNVQVELQKFDGANWNNVSGPVLVPETDLLTGQLPISATTADYSGNMGSGNMGSGLAIHQKFAKNLGSGLAEGAHTRLPHRSPPTGNRRPLAALSGGLSCDRLAPPVCDPAEPGPAGGPVHGPVGAGGMAGVVLRDPSDPDAARHATDPPPGGARDWPPGGLPGPAA